MANIKLEGPDLAFSNTISLDANPARVHAIRIIDDISHVIETLPPGSNLRKQAIDQDILSLRENLKQPAETVIAFCGETGAGKSSLINALLGENIVRTSGMSACTSVVTEVRYSSMDAIEGELEYLTFAEWRGEAAHLLRDLKNTPDGRVKKRDELVEEAALAWAKISAVYPSISEDRLSTMSVEQLMALDSGALSSLLGTTVHIVVDGSAPQKFASEICQYLEPQEDLSTGSHWPLIRKIKISYRSPVLSSGAVLVDLPGTADSNAARSKIAEDYLKSASRFVVVSPITRAVSSKVARDLCGDAFKTQLRLDGKYSPHAITFAATKCDDLSCNETIREYTLKHRLAQSTELKKIDADILMHQKNLDSWAKSASSLKSRLDAQRLADDGGSHTAQGGGSFIYSVVGSKRKPDVFRGDAPWKRQKVSTSQGQVVGVSELDDDLDMEFARAQFSASTAKEKLEQSMMEKTRLLAKIRSEWAEKTLQADFKAGYAMFEDDTEEWDLPELDDFKLPVFMCSSRDYMRIIDKAEGDGAPQCFSNEEDTGIPALSRWISKLTVPAREKATDELFAQLESLLDSVLEFVEGTKGVTPEDRTALQKKWKSKETQPHFGVGVELTARQLRAARYASRPAGVVYQLIKNFEGVSDEITRKLKQSVVSSLQKKCRDSAVLAAGSVVKISDDFAAGMFWSTYGATLRRNGAFRRDLNAELATAFTRRLASSWSQTFKAQHLTSLENSATAAISALLARVVASAPDYLQPRARRLQDSAVREARARLRTVASSVQQTLDEHQQRISRIMAPFVQTHLTPGYEQATAEKGRGHSKRQKKIFHNFLEGKKNTMFVEAAIALQNNLEGAIQSVGETLDDHLERVAKKVEVRMATLWESPLDSEDDVKARIFALATLREHKTQVERWIDARRERERDDD